MSLHRIAVVFLTLHIATVSTPTTLIPLSPGGLRVLAQTPDAQKAEADRLLQQGIEQFQTSQFDAALQSCQQALKIYREIKNRQGEGNALNNLGLAYFNLGDYPS